MCVLYLYCTVYTTCNFDMHCTLSLCLYCTVPYLVYLEWFAAVVGGASTPELVSSRHTPHRLTDKQILS